VGVDSQLKILRRAAVEGFPDILHLHWLREFFLKDESFPLVGPLGVAGAAAACGVLAVARAAGSRIVWTAHNLGNHENRLEWVDTGVHEGVAGFADAIIAHSPTAGREVVRKYRLSRSDKVEVVPHGNYCEAYPNDISQSAARKELGLEADPTVLSFFGYIRPYKNVPRLIDVFRSLPSESGKIRLVVSGSVYSEALEQQVRSHARSDSRIALHLEYISDEYVQVFFNAADVIVLPYRDILTSGTAVLAMSFSRPVIAPKIGTIRDVVGEDGGFLYAPGEPGGLEDAIRASLNTPRQKLRAIGRRNFEHAREWAWSRVAEQTNAVYERAVRE